MSFFLNELNSNFKREHHESTLWPGREMFLSSLVCCLAACYCLSLERTISSSFPSCLYVTQTLSASAFPCFNASCIFAWPILLGGGLLYNFIDSRERDGDNVQLGVESNPQPLPKLLYIRYTLYQVSNVAPQSHLFFLHSILPSLFHLSVPFRLTDVSLWQHMCASD